MQPFKWIFSLDMKIIRRKKHKATDEHLDWRYKSEWKAHLIKTMEKKTTTYIYKNIIKVIHQLQSAHWRRCCCCYCYFYWTKLYACRMYCILLGKNSKMTWVIFNVFFLIFVFFQLSIENIYRHTNTCVRRKAKCFFVL